MKIHPLRFIALLLCCVLLAPLGSVTAVQGAADSDHEGGEFSATYWAALDGCKDTKSAATPAPVPFAAGSTTSDKRTRT